jgi:hypothetical protein
MKKYILLLSVPLLFVASQALAADVPFQAANGFGAYSNTPLNAPGAVFVANQITFSSVNYSAGVSGGNSFDGYIVFYNDASGTSPIASSTNSFAMGAYGCNGPCGTYNFASPITLAAGVTYYVNFVANSQSGYGIVATGQHPAGGGSSGNAPPYDLNSLFFDSSDYTGCSNIVAPILTSPAPSSTVTTDFGAWTVGVNAGLDEGCTFKISVIYTPAIGSLTGGTDALTVSIDPSTPNQVFNITKAGSLWRFYNATTTQINYAVQVQNGQFGTILGTSFGSFNLAVTSTTLNLPPGFDPTKQCGGVCSGFGTIGGGSISTPSSTIAATGNVCHPAADWTDIGGGIAYGFCSTINFLFVPNDSTNGIISGDMAVLETVPPFSWFFQENAALAGVSAGPGGSATYLIGGGGATSTTHTPNNGVSFEIYTGLGNSTTSMTILPADLTTNSFLSDGKLVDDYYNLVLTFVICLAIIAVYNIIL